MTNSRSLNLVKSNYFKFLSADLISQFGAGMVMTSIGWFALDKSGSNQLVAEIANVNIISGLLISIFAGLLVDRFRKKSTIVFSLLLRAALIVIPLVLLAMYGFNKYFLFILALNNGLGWNLYFPASKSLLQMITSKKDLIKMNSGAEITMQIGLFSSGAIAGTLYKYVGFNLILIISISTFVFASAIMTFITVQEDGGKPQNSTSGFTSLFKEGISYLMSHKYIFLLGLTMYMPFVASSTMNVALPGFVDRVLHGNSIVYGLLDMSYGIGAVVAGMTVIKLSRRLSHTVLIMGAFAVAVVCGVFMFSIHSTILSFIFILIFGICGPGIRSIIYTMVMNTVPNMYMGRIMSVWNVISLCLQVVVTYAIGIAMDAINASYGFVFYALIMLIGIVIYAGARVIGPKSFTTNLNEKEIGS